MASSTNKKYNNDNKVTIAELGGIEVILAVIRSNNSLDQEGCGALSDHGRDGVQHEVAIDEDAKIPCHLAAAGHAKAINFPKGRLNLFCK